MLRVLILVLAFAVLAVAPAMAGQHRSMALTRLTGDKIPGEPGNNISGIHCYDESNCILVTDEDHTLIAVRLSHKANGELSYELQSPRLPTGNERKGQLDFEAIAALGDYIIAVGSHGNRKKTGESNPASHQIMLIKLEDFKAGTMPPATWTSLDHVLKRTPPFNSFVGQELQCFGNNIEGAAIVGATLFVGFRSPVELFNRAGFVLAVPLDSAFNPVADRQQVHSLRFNQLLTGIRALEPLGKNLLVATGDSGVAPLKDDDGAAKSASCSSRKKAYPNIALGHDYAIWLWPVDGTTDPVQLVDLSKFDNAPHHGKLEGMAVLRHGEKTFDLLLTFDSDRHLYTLTGIPLPLEEK